MDEIKLVDDSGHFSEHFSWELFRYSLPWTLSCKFINIKFVTLASGAKMDSDGVT